MFKKRAETKKKRIIKEIALLFVLFAMASAFKDSIFESYQIPSGSMLPTLLIGDYIIVNKMNYGLHIPFTSWSLFKKQGPQRGDIVVFQYPPDKTQTYIKRVVGLPGETVEIKDKAVFINGVALNRLEISDNNLFSLMDEPFKDFRLRFYKSHFSTNDFIYCTDDDNFAKNSYEKIKVPTKHYFVMGDNRDYSNDSRFWGFVPEENIKGKVLFVWWSMIFPFGEHRPLFRPTRIGHTF